jgi:energy-coupling factor transporter ATP-binding protein EcfA2
MSTPLTPLIVLQKLRKDFGDTIAVDDVSMSIPASETFGFLGANGAGKTTTTRMLCGLIRPTGGHGMNNPRPKNLFLATVLLCAVAIGLPRLGSAEPAPAQTPFAAAARDAFREAQSQYTKAPNSPEAAWHLARACFDLAEFATRNAERAELAEKGIAACRTALTRASNSAPLHYYLGMNLGQLARTKSLGALKLVNQMEREFTRARDLDEHLDYAGPDGNLGLLYRDAPAIGSVGSRSKARQHLQRAVELAPDYPENRLNLIESQVQWGDHEEARHELQVLEKALPAARAQFSGSTWAASWADWEPRLAAARRKLEEPPKKLETPRH